MWLQVEGCQLLLSEMVQLVYGIRMHYGNSYFEVGMMNVCLGLVESQIMLILVLIERLFLGRHKGAVLFTRNQATGFISAICICKATGFFFATRLQVYLGTLFGGERVAIKVVQCELNGKDVEQLVAEVGILKACR